MCFVCCLDIKNIFNQMGLKMYNKLSSAMPLTFNNIAFFTVTVEAKPCARAKKMCRALEYVENSKTATIVKYHCSKENFTKKYLMSSVHAVCTPVGWQKDSQKYDTYINEEGLYELLFSGQQSKAKNSRKLFCNMMFQHIRK